MYLLPNRMKERKPTMAKETTHRDPIRRAARIERRAKKRDETAIRKKLVKMMKNDANVIKKLSG